MELYQEIIDNLLKEQETAYKTIIELECYRVLRKIKEIIEDETLDDPECFEKIEKIVCLFEQIGSDCGFRHDF